MGMRPHPPPSAEVAGPGECLLYGNNGDKLERLGPEDWPDADLMDLLLTNRPRPIHTWKLDQVMVMAPGVLARFVLRRAMGLGFAVSVSAAECMPLVGRTGTMDSKGMDDSRASVSWLHITWPNKKTPETFLRSLLRLPFVLVTYPLEPTHFDRAEVKLLADIRYAIPLADALVSSLISPLIEKGEHWLLGGPETGHWRVQVHGKPRDAAEFIRGPEADSITPRAITPATMPDTVPFTGNQAADMQLRLIHRASPAGHPDAVLVDDAELDWLRDYLMGKPAAETAYLAPGPGRHLLIAPGGLSTTLPFGIPLRRFGPNGFYLQEGRVLHPPLSEAACTRVFPCKVNEMVAITARAFSPSSRQEMSEPGHRANNKQLEEPAATRFDTDTFVPVWTLWIGEVPTVEEGASSEITRRIRKLAADLQPPKESRWRKQMAKIIPALGSHPRSLTDRDQLLRESMQLERAGRLAEAARCLEQAGELVAAGRLYERAAERRR